MRTFPVLVGLLASTACGTPNRPVTPAGHQSAEEAEVLAVLDAYMHEISENDLAAMKARQMPEGMTYRHRAGPDGSWEVLPRSNMEWVAPTMASDDAFSFSKIDGVWKVSNSMWTVEPQACEELRPANPGEIRPVDAL